ncbi:MAG: methyltransferase domain-containing protein [Anaerolineales bacterium]|nr:methyltransferase domain-containing protein [Anaerolineales bacterium]
MLHEDFYSRYYPAVASSQANASYCEQLYGKNMNQHGFAEVAHLKHLLRETRLGPGQRALDLGCGTGLITEHLAERSGAHFTGIDLEPDAIRQAKKRARGRPDLDFQVMDMAELDFPPASFNAVTAVDTLYFTPLGQTLEGLLPLLKPGGRLAVFWSQGCDPGEPLESFDRRTLPPNFTELGVELNRLGMAYRTLDYSRSDYEHAQRKLAIAESLKAEFEAEGNLFLYEDHIQEANGVIRAFEANAHARYLYLAWWL